VFLPLPLSLTEPEVKPNELKNYETLKPGLAINSLAAANVLGRILGVGYKESMSKGRIDVELGH